MKLLAPKLIVFSKCINLFFLFTNRGKELWVGWLTCKEFLYDFLYIWVTSSSSNLLECIFVLEVLFHFLFHFCFKETWPKLLSKKVFLHLKLIGIFVLVCCLLCNLLLTLHSLYSSFKSWLFVLNRFVKCRHFLLTLTMILIDNKHESFKTVLSLKTDLCSLSLFFGFFFKNRKLWCIALVLFVYFNLCGN